MAGTPVALQLYTLRNEIAEDFAGTLEQVSALGYKGVELAGTRGMPASELRRLIMDLGMEVAGSHVALSELEGNLEAVIDYNLELGNSFVVCPWLPEDRRKSADDYRQLASSLNDIGAECDDRGLQLCYHNHAFEFDRFGEETGLDILLSSTFGDIVGVELDTYWVRYAGEDPAAYIRRYSDRIPLIHLKDMAADADRSFAEFGEGTMDWAPIFDAAEHAGVEWYIVEQDSCKRPPLESVAISISNLRSRGLA